MKYIKKYMISIYNFFNELELCCRFLTIIAVISFFVISISILNHNLDATGNLVTIRTAFSSIIGYILEKSTSSCNPDAKALKIKTLLVGSFSILSMIVIILSYVFNIPVDNPSLILFKNLFFSSIGFLTSSSGSYRK
ncbi:MAG: hypothetical protein ACRC3Y_07540 [Romboutsia sp.]|uniref:hypothetical protein n=1 Tax=Romboutsia sp. TaxID=1965302 RepID=UPI003F2B81B2